jgi:hypothetical protein
MVADVMGYDEKKFRDGLRARLEKEFYRTYRGKLNIKQII